MSNNEINNINEIVELLKNELDFTIILFYAPWCGHCTKMKPHFDAVSTEFNQHNFCKVDCTKKENEIIPSQFNIEAFPTIVIVDKDTIVHNKAGGLNKEQLFDVITSKTNHKTGGGGYDIQTDYRKRYSYDYCNIYDCN